MGKFRMQLTAAFLVRTVLAVVVAVAHHRLRDALPVCAEIETIHAKRSKLKQSESGVECFSPCGLIRPASNQRPWRSRLLHCKHKTALSQDECCGPQRQGGPHGPQCTVAHRHPICGVRLQKWRRSWRSKKVCQMLTLN